MKIEATGFPHSATAPACHQPWPFRIMAYDADAGTGSITGVMIISQSGALHHLRCGDTAADTPTPAMRWIKERDG